MTRTISIGGTVRYIYQDRDSKPGTAGAFGALIDLAYKGLGSPQR